VRNRILTSRGSLRRTGFMKDQRKAGRSIAPCLALLSFAGLAAAGEESDNRSPPARPPVLDRLPDGVEAPAAPPPPSPVVLPPLDPPLGFAGPSGIVPRDEPDPEGHFAPVEDRWRVGLPEWDRYGSGHPLLDDSPYTIGRIFNPYNQNVLKGDYPIIGQHTFLNVSALNQTLVEAHQVPTPATVFDSTARSFESNLFGRPNQFWFDNNLVLSLDLFHGDAAFKPIDWRIRLTPVFNVNDLNVEELGVVNPDVREGTGRGRTFTILQEWFVEAKLADLGPDYDFVSVRAGSQPFTSDFRGFLFSDTNRALRLFGTLFDNRDQFNLVVFDQLEKETNSELNSFHDRKQQVVIANYYSQDFLVPGYTAQASMHYDHDQPSFRFDANKFLVRPDPVGVFQPHQVDVVYLGWAGNGHIDRINVTHQLYWALGHDSLNPLANQHQDINAQMAALEVSYDRDWMRFKTSCLWASGDENINNTHATGFDTILDNPQFAGGEFSYWQRQAIPLFGVHLVNRQSLMPDLRSSKFDGQANFVNPGLFLYNFGVDMDLTPTLKMFNNVNLLWFDEVAVLKQFTFQETVHRHIGTDLSVGFEYRPLLSNNIIARFGVSGLIPGEGLKDIYNNLTGTQNPLLAGFLELNLAY
jgi:hypothetical protein